MVIKQCRFDLFKAKTMSFYGCKFFFLNSAYQNDVVLHYMGSKRRRFGLIVIYLKRRRFGF